MGGLNGIISGATQKMAVMNSVAQTLGNVLSSALVSAMQAAQVQASGAGAAMQKYAQDIMNGNQVAASADYGKLLSDLGKLGLSAQQATQLVASVTTNLNSIPKNVISMVTVNYRATGSAAANINGAHLNGYATGTPAAARMGMGR